MLGLETEEQTPSIRSKTKLYPGSSLLRCKMSGPQGSFCMSPATVEAIPVRYSINPSDNYLMEFCHVG